MLLYRGALVYAEDRNHDDRSGLTPPELEVMTHLGRVPTAVHATITVSPQVHQGRCLIPCPWCFSASMASREDPRFFCVECRNVGAQGKWIKVVWPADWESIEAVLIARSDPRTRGWYPHETVADLFVENESHGVI